MSHLQPKGLTEMDPAVADVLGDFLETGKVEPTEVRPKRAKVVAAPVARAPEDDFQPEPMVKPTARLSVDLDKEKLRALKIYAIKRRMTLRELIESLAVACLDR